LIFSITSLPLQSNTRLAGKTMRSPVGSNLYGASPGD
jgi:hypothetical protein